MRLLITTVALLLSLAATAWADGCYSCGNGSSPTCRDYCSYSGVDTFKNRHACEAAGCRITGTSACPTSSTAKICQPAAGARSTEASLSLTCAPPRR